MIFLKTVFWGICLLGWYLFACNLGEIVRDVINAFTAFKRKRCKHQYKSTDFGGCDVCKKCGKWK